MMHYVLCDVGTKCLTIIYISFNFKKLKSGKHVKNITENVNEIQNQAGKSQMPRHIALSGV